MAAVGEREHNRGVVVLQVISGLPEAEVDRTLVAAQRHGATSGLKPRELLHQVPEIGGAGVQQRRGRLPRSPRAAAGLGIGVIRSGVCDDGGVGGGVVVVELGPPLIAGDRHVKKLKVGQRDLLGLNELFYVSGNICICICVYI